MTEIFITKSDDEIKACFPVIVQLRPSYTEAEFLSQVKCQHENNYHLAYLKDNETVCSVAGYRYSENLAWGKFLYVDDLVTDNKQRSHGYGKVLLNWLIEQARNNHCKQMHLDSGVQRIDAHRFYQREAFINTGHHYAFTL